METLKQPNARVTLWLTVVALLLLVYFLKGWQAIPMHSIWGIDLQCLWTFHHCKDFANSPYLVEGHLCGDMYDRPMVYPPLHYWTFAWTRLLEFKSAVIYLAIAILGVLFASYHWMLQGRAHSLLKLGFWTLLVLQYPTIFQIERGSNDLPVYLWFLASLWAFQKGRYLWSGLFCALCASTKLYPVFLLLPVFFAAFLNPKTRSFCGGALLGLLLAHGFFPQDTLTYFLEVMPKHASNAPPIFDEATVSHSVRSIFPSKTWLALSLFFLAVAGIAYQAHRLLSREPFFIFAVAIALSSYFATVSYDYHLILVYPLLFFVFLRAQETQKPLMMLWLLLALCAFFWDRQFLIDHKLGALLTKIQFTWLSLTIFFGHWILGLRPLKNSQRPVSA